MENVCTFFGVLGRQLFVFANREHDLQTEDVWWFYKRCQRRYVYYEVQNFIVKNQFFQSNTFARTYCAFARFS